MYQIEIDNRISQIIQNFYRFGVWRNEDGISHHFKLGWKLSYLTIYICFVASLILGGLLSGDKNEFVFLVGLGVANIVVTLKLAYILWKKEEICEFLSDIGKSSIEDEDEFVKVNKKVKNFMKFSFSFMLTVFVYCIALIILYLPIFTSEKKLPLNVWVPFDWKNNEFVYWLAFAYVSASLLISATAVSFNAILWYLIMNCAIKYEILGNQFRNVATTTSTKSKKKATEKERQKLLFEHFIGLIETHRNIQETIDRFKSCFANLFLAQIVTSGCCICGSVYKLAFGDNKDLLQLVICIIVLCYNLFDIFVVVYMGNEIMLSSDRLSYCLFESNWIEQSMSFKNCFIILTEVLKQPHILMIGKLYPLTLETFTAILNLAYSMFNILQNFN